MKEVKRFKCDYCSKTTARESTMRRREHECVHNPNAVNCFCCEYACVDELEDEWSTRKDVPQCAYNQEELIRGWADCCSFYKHSDKLCFERSFEEAEGNFDRDHIPFYEGE